MKTTITHAPPINCTNRYLIVGSEIDELIYECVSRIKPQSKGFYKRELRIDLMDTGKSMMIDSHAGMGSVYIVSWLDYKGITSTTSVGLK
jgi:hypothetical protein